MRTFFDSTQSQESKSEVCTHVPLLLLLLQLPLLPQLPSPSQLPLDLVISVVQLVKHNISQAVRLAVTGWICILLVGAQNREHHKCLIQASKPTAMKRMKNEAAALQKMKDVAACEYHSFFGYLLLTIPGHEVSNICVVFNKST